MMTYLVVHHKQDINQPWVNSWLGDSLLDAIQTNGPVATLCSTAHRCGQPIFVHRCAFGIFSPATKETQANLEQLQAAKRERAGR